LTSSNFVLALISVSFHFCSVSTFLTKFFGWFTLLVLLVSASKLEDTISSSSAIRRTWDLRKSKVGAKPNTAAERIKRVVKRSIVCLCNFGKWIPTVVVFCILFLLCDNVCSSFVEILSCYRLCHNFNLNNNL